MKCRAKDKKKKNSKRKKNLIPSLWKLISRKKKGLRFLGSSHWAFFLSEIADSIKTFDVHLRKFSAIFFWVTENYCLRLVFQGLNCNCRVFRNNFRLWFFKPTPFECCLSFSFLKLFLNSCSTKRKKKERQLNGVRGFNSNWRIHGKHWAQHQSVNITDA